jgi:cytochrome P450
MQDVQELAGPCTNDASLLYRIRNAEDPVSLYPEMLDKGPYIITPAGVVATHYREIEKLVSWPVPDPPWYGRRQPTWLNSQVNQVLAGNLLFNNGVWHQQERRKFMTVFSARAVGCRRASIQKNVHEALDRFHCALSRDGQADFVEQVSGYLPFQRFCQYFGYPEKDVNFIREIADAIAPAQDTSPRPSVIETASRACEEFATYVHRHAREDTLHLACGPAGSTQRFAQIMMILIGGIKTTTGLLSGIYRAWCDQPTSPITAREQVDFIEEVLRLYSPAMAIMRYNPHDVVIADTRIPADTWFLIHLGCAHRDPSVFGDTADQFIPGRAQRSIPFSRGHHYCLGANVAATEAGELLTQLVRYPRGKVVEVVYGRDRNTRPLEKMVVQRQSSDCVTV